MRNFLIILNCFLLFNTLNGEGGKYRILKRHQISNNLIISDIKSFQSSCKFSCLRECNLMDENCLSVSMFRTNSNTPTFQCSLFSEDNSSLVDLNAYVYNELSNVYLKKSGEALDFCYLSFLLFYPFILTSR
jgi:hypothetical protein